MYDELMRVLQTDKISIWKTKRRDEILTTVSLQIESHIADRLDAILPLIEPYCIGYGDFLRTGDTGSMVVARDALCDTIIDQFLHIDPELQAIADSRTDT